MTVKKEFDINLTPQELAELFCGMFSDDQAEFFAECWKIAKDWPGAGWCSQSYAIWKDAEGDALNALRGLAAHKD